MAEAGFGDRLARGSKSAVFPSLSHISEERWTEIFGPRETKIREVFEYDIKAAPLKNGRKIRSRKSSS